MNILILGAGQVGTTLAESLSLEHNVTVVDIDEDCLIRIQNRLDVRTVSGYAASPDVLTQAGAEDADLLIAVTSSDETNMIACQVAYSLFKTPTKIARVRGYYYDNYPQLFESGDLAIDTMINPAELVTERLERQIQHPGALAVLDFADGQLQIAVVSTTPPSVLNGRKIQELSHELADFDAEIIGVLRDGSIVMAMPDLVIKPHDLLLYSVRSEHLNAVTQALTHKEQRYRRIMIAGGGNIGVALAKRLQDTYKVKLLERDPERCEVVAEQLNNVVVLNGDSADTELLISENIDEIDLFCTVTNDDEANIMSAIVAKRLGAKATVALVNRQTYAHFLIERSPDIDMALSPQRITGSKILTYLRKGDIVNLYTLPNITGEALEVVVHGDAKSSKVIGRQLGDIKWPSDSYLCGVYRDEKLLMPSEIDTIKNEDRLIFVLADRRSVAQLEKLLQVAPGFV